MLRSRFVVRGTFAALIAATGYIAVVTPSTSLRAGAGGADADLSALQQRVDRLQGLTARVEAISAIGLLGRRCL